MVSEKTQRTCKNGHKYFKSSDCQTCPKCEEMKKPTNSFLDVLAAPARRAMENNGITTIIQLSKYSTDDILQFHGMGPSSIPKLQKALKDKGLTFNE